MQPPQLPALLLQPCLRLLLCQHYQRHLLLLRSLLSAASPALPLPLPLVPPRATPRPMCWVLLSSLVFPPSLCTSVPGNCSASSGKRSQTTSHERFHSNAYTRADVGDCSLSLALCGVDGCCRLVAQRTEALKGTAIDIHSLLQQQSEHPTATPELTSAASSMHRSLTVLCVLRVPMCVVLQWQRLACGA